MYNVAALCHIIASGFYTCDSVCACHIKLIDLIFADKVGELFARQRIAFALYENIVGHDFHVRNQLCPAHIGLKCPRTGC